MPARELTFGNGVDREYDLTHELGTTVPLWALYSAAGREVQQGEAGAEAVDGNTFRFTFAVAVPVNGMRVVFFKPPSVVPEVMDEEPGGAAFFSAFNASLAEAENVMGERWSLGDQNYMAIEIDDVTTEMRAMPGGRFRNIAAVVHVRLAVFLASAVADGSIVTVRGDRMRVTKIEKDGDDARALYCGPVQINTSGLL